LAPQEKVLGPNSAERSSNFFPPDAKQNESDVITQWVIYTVYCSVYCTSIVP